MTPEEFYAQYMPYAQGVSQRTGLDPRLVLAQAALETGYGKSAPNSNFFGIKSHGRAGGQTLQTSEFEGGRMVGQPASFRGYESPAQSFQDYGEFIMSNPRYEGVRSADGLGEQIVAMASSGYATDPQYGAKLASIATRFDPDSPAIIGADAMRAIGKQPMQGRASTQGAAPMMQEEQQPRGLLGTLGIQKMEEGAPGETGQRFYQRDAFKDTAATLAQAFAGLTDNPALQKAASDVAGQRTEAKARNKTIEYLRANGRGDLADMIDAGQVNATDAMSSLFGKAIGATEDPTATRALKMQAEMAGLTPGTPEYQEFMLYGGGAPSNFRSLDMQAKAAGYTPGTPDYERFMASRGAFEKTAQTAQATAETAEAQQLIEMTRNLPGLYDVVDELSALAEVATYTAAGRAADELAKQAGMPASEGAQARAAYIGTVDNQVLPLLRQTFGAAFTAEEGNRLRATLGDENSSPEEKKATLNAFIRQKQREVVALGGALPERPTAPAAAAPAATGKQRLIYNPATGKLE